MKTSDFWYDLPEELIAQTPLAQRDSSRLLVLDRFSGEVQHKHFYDIIDYLQPGDCLVMNDSRVLPARLLGHRPTGGAAEVLLLRDLGDKKWECLCKPGRKMQIGSEVIFGDGELTATVVEVQETGNRVVEFHYEGIFLEVLERLGKMPLPPYIKAELADQERYQTVYSREVGSAAAPTAGLHFTADVLAALEAKGVKRAEVTLHVGAGTFKPVSEEVITDHKMHTEHFVLSRETADLINATRAAGKKVVAVGTTTVRTLESCADESGIVHARSGATNIFLYPPYQPRSVDMLVTNFHLPKSTLLMLVSCFADREKVLNAYQTAIENKMRFYSYGDCMLFI